MTRRAFGLAEMLAAASLWAALAVLLSLILVNGSRGLSESESASRLCLAAAALDSELATAQDASEPRPDRSAKQMVLLDARGQWWRYEVRGRDLVAVPVGGVTTSTAVGAEPPEAAPPAIESAARRPPPVETGPPRIVARGIELAIFHARSSRPRVLRYFLSSGGRPLLSSSWLGEGR